MHHATLYFVRELPNVFQRWTKCFTFYASLPLVGLVALFNEASAVHLLTYIGLAGVSVQDAAIASQRAAPRLKQALNPAIKRELDSHLKLGRQVTILSGNILPFIQAFVETELQVSSCVCTKAEVSPCNTFYTGSVEGRPCVGEAKVERLELLINGMQDEYRPKQQQQVEQQQKQCQYNTLVFGYGNSVNDIPFLVQCTAPFPVTPDERLLKFARIRGWPLHFV
eukprot:m.6286 g.6286  ORF g.6286 m.6286 type:complete len:224 (-) comp5950_c0_seq1:61-732(-)